MIFMHEAELVRALPSTEGLISTRAYRTHYIVYFHLVSP